MKAKLLPFVLLSVLIVVGCDSSVGPLSTLPTNTNTLSPTPSIIASQVPLTVMEMTEKSSTQTPVPTSTRILPTVTETPSLPPTPTALPVISSDTAKEVLTRFVQDNGGCKLPCVFGLTPGISDQMAVEAFMSYFQENSYQYRDQIDSVDVSSDTNDDRGGLILDFFENRLSVLVVLNYQVDGSELNQIYLGADAYQLFGEGAEQGSKALYEHSYYEELAGVFFLPNIFETNGPPSQILIRPFPTDPEFPPSAQYPFDFVLLYPEQGFLIEYISVREEQGEFYIGCPTKAHIDISSWDPDEAITLVEAVQSFENFNGINELNADYFKPIQDVTSLSIDAFYEMFKDQNSEGCVQTPKELWP